MIETKEQYERAQREALSPDVHGPTNASHQLIETIEALREVARAAHRFGDTGTMSAEIRMHELLAALPDWLTDD